MACATLIQESTGFEKFGVNLYQNVASFNRADEKIFISPASIAFGISMCAVGARNNTLNQILYSFGAAKSIDELNQTVEEVMQIIKSADEDNTVKLKLANQLYIQQDYQLLDEYLSCLKQFYSADIKLTDFDRNKATAVREINDWVAQVTNNLIKDVLNVDDVDRHERLVLINCIYFKGTWVNKFNKEYTMQNSTFTSDNGIISKIPLMYQKRRYAYSDDSTLQAQIAHIPYNSKRNSNHQFVFTVILPKRGVKLINIEKKLLDGQLLKQALSNKSQHELNFYLPKFKMECRLDLNTVLMNLGITDAFNRQHADFSGIEPTKELYISQVVHKAFIDVNETGSEAAAATSISMRKKAKRLSNRPEPIEFRCDHPFLFMIREMNRDLTLFMGRYV
ncbi:unnamed protein product [Didymodactylos carnosus]|uniref:Serpin domain-containing protein n=1 Tax=Didymodactylos carnosus TaxID=1234261 RepID=A0A815ASM7_9BILA|nr:unnamed protein product [Didymodactylos carnosus]CAF4039398.1 unnamed protein product [Didymodactylos carnosus]